MVYQFMKANKNRYTIKEMAEILGVRRSGYYKWVKNGMSGQGTEADAELVRHIREIIARHCRRYGSPLPLSLSPVY
jgi:predicted site-specific integrase-resolvase